MHVCDTGNASVSHIEFSVIRRSAVSDFRIHGKSFGQVGAVVVCIGFDTIVVVVVVIVVVES